ncbi:hypothetical protein [Ilyomonas limi]|uniref:hypothetical protein n=1 Tax=Ilyomonas limi TaxID=2575867 RepID=UPI001484EBBE|nr:hypothetical protein [Ilyomonas limi]
MEHPEVPITDQDIENLILDIPSVSTLDDNGIENSNNFKLYTINENNATLML